MFKPMALTVIFALVGALVLALTLMPVLCSYLLGGASRERQLAGARLQGALHAAAELGRCASSWVVVLPMPCCCSARSLFVFTRLGAEFIPQLDEGTMLLQFIRSSSAGWAPPLDLQKKSEKLSCWKSFPKSANIVRLDRHGGNRG
jgi:cobalt-zinc-cadmium resistance protein CzcA